jgi:hypothetical protein
MSDFDGCGDIRQILQIDRNDEPSARHGGGSDVSPQLHQKDPRGFGLRAAIGDLGHPANLLQQLQHFYFGRHTQFLNCLLAVLVPDAKTRMPKFAGQSV